MKSDLGIIGLGVMGRNLSRNFGRNGFRLSLYNRRVEGLEEDIALSLIEQFEELKSAAGFEDLELFVKSLQAPRVIILMVTAGEVVDKIVHALAAFSEPGDTLID
ncbi:MAG: NADP-dependent phosphogluconate dehydrogenase, partial [Bacteroidia bacterium]|nr:NADP-dependent phosphogluconate dehydrogenase [Bacteroidia bacterium]